MSAIRFHLNGEGRAETNIPPSMTVLDYLRGVARLTGTKEGCAEGDCGACTIVIGERQDGQTHYRAVNSCLMTVPQLHGSSVLTVEGLAGKDGALHPVQHALVEADATQCGFCTPGFVMAMFAFAQGSEAGDDETIHEALAGNLCRCTGYRPIVEACRKIAGQTTALAPPPDVAPCEKYSIGEQACYRPRSLGELVALRAQHPDALILGGGTDLGLLFSKERKSFPETILTGDVRDMKFVREGRDAIEIGGAATYADALPALDRHFLPFAALVRRIGSRQIRNLGTFAGNLATASPIGDTAPPLMALGASVMLQSASGQRTMRVDEFITGYRKTAMRPDEVIASIRIPYLPVGEDFAVYKLSKRFDQDISTVVAAFRLKRANGNVETLRAVFGGMAATPARAKSAEATLAGRSWTAEAMNDLDAAIASDFSPLTDQRGSAQYRLLAAANLLRRFQIETSGEPALARLEAL